MKSVLVLSLSDLRSDPRVHRQLQCLAGRFRVTAAGLAPPSVAVERYIPMQAQAPQGLAGRVKAALLLLLRRFETYYWSRPHVTATLRGVGSEKFDVILANDLNTLPLALKIAGGRARVVFDAHEFAPREFEDLWTWRLFFQRFADVFCRRYLPKVDAMMTVCDGIAEEYRRLYGVASIVVTSAPPYQALAPAPVQADVVRMIHHGSAIPSRKLELMIDMMRHLDPRFRLDFMLMPVNRDYLARLQALAAGDERIRFLDPVPMPDIPAFCNRYDIGVFLLPPVNYNYAMALPNKFFEFVQARLAIAIGPSPEMARLVRRHDIGVVSDDFSPASLAKQLQTLSAERIAECKRQADLAARELCAENNQKLILGLVEGGS